jgi:hypothetical protein
MLNWWFWKGTVIKQQTKAHFMKLQMDFLCNPLTPRQFLMGWEISNKPYPNWQIRCIYNLDHKFGNVFISTSTCPQNHHLGRLLILVVSKANSQSFGRQSNSTSKNLRNWSGSSTVLSWISGRKYVWLNLWRLSFGALSVQKTVWNSIKKDCSPAEWLLQLFWQISQHSCLFTYVTMPNWLEFSGLKRDFRNVHTWLKRCE